MGLRDIAEAAFAAQHPLNTYDKRDACFGAGLVWVKTIDGAIGIIKGLDWERISIMGLMVEGLGVDDPHDDFARGVAKVEVVNSAPVGLLGMAVQLAEVVAERDALRERLAEVAAERDAAVAEVNAGAVETGGPAWSWPA